MSLENLLWGAPRIHGELLKLGFEIAQSSVAKYMVKRRGPPSQGWWTFLRNHAPDIAAMDFFVVPTIGFKLLYGFVIIRLDRRDIVWINVTTNPTAEWVARQITEAFPWDRGGRAEDFASVAPIFTANCAGCHNPKSGLPIPPLTSYEEIAKIVHQDPGPSVSQLARVSHIHLFGISIIFLLTGAIFSLSSAPIWLRISLVVLPYITIVMDIGSWWATKYLSPIFAYIVIGGGALMGLALALQIFISVWEMWIDPLKRGFRISRTRAP
jgi:hypothetical protein